MNKEQKLVRGEDLITVGNEVNRALALKHGTAYFDSETNYLYFFKNNADKEAWLIDPESATPISYTLIDLNVNVTYQVLIENLNDSTTLNTSTNVDELNLMASFVVQRTVDGTHWTATGQGVNVRCYVDINTSGTFVEVPVNNSFVVAGGTFTINAMPYLTAGNHRFKIEMYPEGASTSMNSLVYSINVSEMYVELMNNTWNLPIIQGDSNTYKFGGFKIVGALSKTLHIDIYPTDSSTRAVAISKLIGNNTYIDTAYNYTEQEGFNITTLSNALSTGVYKADVYLTSGDLESTHVFYNFMYIEAADASTAKIVCINNVADTAYNYSSSKLCEYAVYDGGLSTTDVDVIIDLDIDGTTSTVVNETYDGVTTGVIQELLYSGEIETESTNMELSATIGVGETEESITMPFDNSSSYPAEIGSVFYMNASTRSNATANHDKIINLADDSEIQGTWSKIDFFDGIDGWIADPDGRKGLLITAGSSLTIPYQALYHGENTTFEICFRAANVADYDENIITVATNPTSDGFSGIRIKPTNVTVHSASDINASNDTERGTNFRDDVTQHLLVSIAKAYRGNTGRNLVSGYLNGSKAFQFEYADGTVWNNSANIVIGGQKTDVYVYLIRVYEKALDASSAEQNYINSIPSLTDRAITATYFNSVLNQSTREITYEQMILNSNNYNFFVVDMLNGASIPSRANNWSKETTGYSNFEMHYGEHPEWDFKLYEVETSGQGTTSMDYYRWNLRFRIDKSNSSKKIQVAYYNAPTTSSGSRKYNEKPSSSSKVVFFDGGENGSTANHPALKRITAKINFASSMQSHKIGATRAYNVLHDRMNLANEAQQIDPRTTVAVYEYPAFGFAKHTSAVGTVSYTYIGLFTIGPDKGDKPTFGYDVEYEDGGETVALEDSLITLEGTDHTRKLATFSYPWNSDVQYLATNECLNIVKGNNDYDNGIEVGNCHGYSSDKATDQASIQSVLETEFKPAYEVAWKNSTLIFAISLSHSTYGASTPAGVLANIRADKANFLEMQYNDKLKFSNMQFWIESDYTLYYYDIKLNDFVADMNMATDSDYGVGNPPAGLTLLQQNEWFKAQRRNNFLTYAPNYWDIQDAIFHFCYLLMFGATDNFAKNTYPYKMKTLANGGRWKWRQDDLDTIFDIDNAGGQTKPYYIEFQDGNNGSPVFAGSASTFWNLLFETFWDDYGVNMGIESFGKAMMQAMNADAHGANVKDGCVAFIKKYFWDYAQAYFPPSAYNVDANFKYETAWLANGQSVPPLSQSLGNHYEAEMLWAERRVIYMMSLFKAGAFGSYADTSLGSIQFRPISFPTYEVTPNMWMYPAIMNGQAPVSTSRTEANTEKEFINMQTQGETTFYIQASNYLSEIGSFRDVNTGSYAMALTVNGRKLQEFRIGDDSTVDTTSQSYVAPTTDIPGLVLPNNVCLERLYARNAESLTGALDLTNLPRLKEALLGGTSFVQVNLQDGSKIEILELPDTIVNLKLTHINDLVTLTMPSDMSAVTSLTIEKCNAVQAVNLLKDIYDSNGALKYIRLIWDGTETVGITTLEALQYIANHSIRELGIDDGYGGTEADGSTTNYPVIEGSLTIPEGVEVDADFVYDIAEAFPTTSFDIPSSQQYIDFEDAEVERLCLANWDTNQDERLMRSEAEAVTVASFVNSIFSNNTTIETFDEFKYFTGMNYLPGSSSYQGGPFSMCTSLKSITFPSTITNIGNNYGCCFSGSTALEEVKNFRKVEELGYSSFQGCTSLKTIDLNGVKRLKGVSSNSFYGCSALAIEVNMPNLTSIDGTGAFYQSGITKIINLGAITTLPANSFAQCTSLTEAHLPNTVTTLSGSVFNGDTALTTVTGTGNVTSVSGEAFRACSSLTSIDLDSVTYIGENTFRDCYNLESIGDGDNTNGITLGTNAFMCSSANRGSLKSFPFEKVISFGNVASNNTFQYQDLDGVEVDLSNLTDTYIPTTLFMETNISKVASLGNAVVISGGTNLGAFRNCKKLTEVHLPTTLTDIGYHTFLGCSALETIDGLNNVTYIGNYAFAGCTALTSITLNNVQTIGDYAFQSCTSMPSTLSFIPKTIKTLGAYVFDGWTQLTEVDLSGYTNLEIIDRTFMNINTIQVLDVTGCTSLIEFEPYCGGATAITSIDLSTCTSLKRLGKISNSVESLIVPNSLEEIIGECFRNCFKLNSIDFSSTNLKTIGIRGFYDMWNGTSPDRVFKLPSTVETIAGSNFAATGTNTTIVILATTPPTNSTTSSNSNWYVPYSADHSILTAYQTATNWSNWASNIHELNSDGTIPV